MKTNQPCWRILPAYIIVIAALFFCAFGYNRAVTVISQNTPIKNRVRIVIDPGHGGVDGGATSCSGRLESSYNLEISLKLQEVMHLLGLKTRIIRTDDRSVYTKGETIREKKISDIRERIRIVNEEHPSLLVSIHQNHFGNPQYRGAQVFYNGQADSQKIAERMQSALIENLNPGSKRSIKKADGIFLMERIQNPGVLIECGFLSNPQEEALLRDPTYQKRLCVVIASEVSNYLNASAS